MSTYKFMKPKASYLKKVISYLSASKGIRKKAWGFVPEFFVGTVDCRTPMQACYFFFLCHNMKISCMKTHLLMNWLQERTTLKSFK
jgi:hypothetical protein